jgi:hypothetical protein
MKNTVAAFAALAIASIVAAGCSGNGNSAITTSGPTPIPTPSVACTNPPGEAIQEVFPQNGATGVANLQGVVIAVAPNPLPTNWFFYAKFGPNQQVTYPQTISGPFLPLATPSPGASTTPTPFPTPSDAPSFAPSFGTPIFEAASFGTFATSAQFIIFLANTNCFPGLQMSSFTTATVDTPTATPSASASPTASPT